MRRRGFTMIELLTVIGVITVLVAMVAYGLSKMSDRTKVSQTKVALENLRSMVAELETVSKGLNRQPAQMWSNGAQVPALPTDPPPPGRNIWLDGVIDGLASASNPEPDALIVPRQQPPGSGNITAAGGQVVRYGSDAIGNTQKLMGLLLQTPLNKRVIEQIPPSQLMESLPPNALAGGATVKLTVGSAAAAYSNTNVGAPNPPLVLDGWGNPVLFVPGGGLCGNPTFPMYIGGEPSSPGVRQVVQFPATANELPPIRAGDNRPFWASAGPDGDFSKADDNIYSFEN